MADYPAFAAQQTDLSQLAQNSRRRELAGRTGADFSSNDYLGLAGSPVLANAVQAALERGVSVGSGGSRLLRGNHPEHEALEAEAADFFGSERALWFSSGFAANSALLSALPQRGDLIVHDELIHASAHEGMRLGRAENIAVRHNDANAFEIAVTNWRRQGGPKCRQGPDLACGRKPLQHGRRPRAAGRSCCHCRAA